MSFTLFFIFSLIFFAAPYPGHCQGLVFSPQISTRVLTLQDCYQLALNQNENLKIQNENLIQQTEQYNQVFGSLYPKFSFNASEFLQDTSGTSNQNGVPRSFTLEEQPTAKFTLNQLIFAGLREFSTSSALKAQARRTRFSLERSKKLLFLEVTNAFYQVLQGETDLVNVESFIALARDRVKELSERAEIGKSRKSEILSAKSQLAALTAQKEQIKSDLANARETLSLLIGIPSMQFQLKDSLLRLVDVPAKENFLDRALKRSDVLALQQEVQSQKYLLKTAKGTLLPTASALGNYYTKRTGFQELIDWDVTFLLSIPIFEGGTNRAAIREAASKVREAEINLGLLIRQVHSQIAQSYNSLAYSIAQERSWEESYKEAEESYKLQVKEYRLGLVNNLEVLQALNALQETKKNFDRALIRSKAALLQLQVTAEEMP